MDGGVDVDCGDDRLVVFFFPPWRSSAIEPDPGPGGSRAKNNNVARRDDDAPLLQELGSQHIEFGAPRRVEDGQSRILGTIHTHDRRVRGICLGREGQAGDRSLSCLVVQGACVLRA